MTDDTRNAPASDKPRPPLGFRASAVAAGLKYEGRRDLGLIVADDFHSSAGVFTTSVTKAAPVIWSSERSSRARAILANSGQANAQTGERGLDDCREAAREAAKTLNLTPDDITICSTGVIGQPLNLPKILGALPELAKKLSTEGFDDFAKAIMTTDTVPKKLSTEVVFPTGPPATVWGAAKGSGMIAPNMATMLGFILTDAPVEAGYLREILKEGADISFNRITIDGDTSTNDSLVIVSSGASGRAPIARGGACAKILEKAVHEAMLSLSLDMVRDGEGATKVCFVAVKNARNLDHAQKAAKTVAESLLFKTALFGSDANWGRILAALGRSGAEFDPYQVDLDLGSVPWVRFGLDNGRDKEATEEMRSKELTLTIDLKAGKFDWTMLTCDLSYR